MLKQLKECKTFGEMYKVLGEEGVSKVAAFILMCWCLLPVIAGFVDMCIHIKYNSYAPEMVSKYAIIYGGMTRILGGVTFVLWIMLVMAKNQYTDVSFGNMLKDKIKKEIWIGLLLFMWGWSLISSFMAESIYLAFIGTEIRNDGFFTYCIYAAVMGCAYFISDKKLIRQIIDFFIVMATWLGVVMLCGESDFTEIGAMAVGYDTSIFMNSNHYGYYLTMAGMCMLGMSYWMYDLYAKSKEKQYIKKGCLYILAYTFQMFVLMKNNTMGAYLSLVVGGVVVLVLIFVRNRKIGIFHFIPFAITALLTMLSEKGYITNVLGETIGDSIKVFIQDIFKVATNAEDIEHAGTNRVGIWLRTIKLIPDNPIFGVGPEMLQGEYVAINRTDRPHNEILQHAVFLGIPAAIMYLSSLVGLFVNKCKNIKNISMEQLVASAAVIGYFIGSNFGNTMFYTTPYFFMFLGMVASISLSRE